MGSTPLDESNFTHGSYRHLYLQPSHKMACNAAGQHTTGHAQAVAQSGSTYDAWTHSFLVHLELCCSLSLRTARHRKHTLLHRHHVAGCSQRVVQEGSLPSIPVGWLLGANKGVPLATGQAGVAAPDGGCGAAAVQGWQALGRRRWVAILACTHPGVSPRQHPCHLMQLQIWTATTQHAKTLIITSMTQPPAPMHGGEEGRVRISAACRVSHLLLLLLRVYLLGAGFARQGCPARCDMELMLCLL